MTYLKFITMTLGALEASYSRQYITFKKTLNSGYSTISTDGARWRRDQEIDYIIGSMDQTFNYMTI